MRDNKSEKTSKDDTGNLNFWGIQGRRRPNGDKNKHCGKWRSNRDWKGKRVKVSARKLQRKTRRVLTYSNSFFLVLFILMPFSLFISFLCLLALLPHASPSSPLHFFSFSSSIFSISCFSQSNPCLHWVSCLFFLLSHVFHHLFFRFLVVSSPLFLYSNTTKIKTGVK